MADDKIKTEIPPSPFVHPEDRGVWAKRRWRLHEILEVGSISDRASVLFDTFIVVLIITNVIVFAASTVADLDAVYGNWFELFNLASVMIFTLEYLARLWICIDLPPLRHMVPWKARLKFAMTPLLIIDLLAILPFYLGNLVGVDLRVLRVLRLLRFLKIARYSPALQILLRVVKSELWALFGALIIMASLILLSAALLYFIEREAQPEQFGSLPAAMWWSLATLTTVGYGDVVPVTPLGKVFGGMFMLFGLAMYALPIGILSSGFAREIARNEFVITWNMVARVPLFARLEASEVAEIMKLLQSHRHGAGSIILRPGDRAESMYFISEGEVRVEARGGEVVILKEGDHFGEMALLEKRRRRVAVVAQTDCLLLQLDAQDFEYLLATHNHVAEHMRTISDLRKSGEWHENDPAEPESGSWTIPVEDKA
jgi:voltage-gated potassium channel